MGENGPEKLPFINSVSNYVFNVQLDIRRTDRTTIYGINYSKGFRISGH